MAVGAEPGDRHEEAARGHRARSRSRSRRSRAPPPTVGARRRSRPRRAGPRVGAPHASDAPSQSMVGSLRSWLERSRSGGGAPVSLGGCADRDTCRTTPRPGAGGPARGDGTDDPRRHGIRPSRPPPRRPRRRSARSAGRRRRRAGTAPRSAPSEGRGPRRRGPRPRPARPDAGRSAVPEGLNRIQTV